MFLISLSLISCKNDKTNNSLEKVLEFVNDSGEKIIIDESMDFYEVYNLFNFKTAFGLCYRKKASFDGELKLGDYDKYAFDCELHLKDDDNYFAEIKTIIDGSSTQLLIQELKSIEYISKFSKETKQYSLAKYNNYLALNGNEKINYTDKANYAGPNPVYPIEGTKFYDIWYPSTRLMQLLCNCDIFAQFNQLDNTSIEGESIYFDTYVKRNYTIDGDCIIFEQIAPFISILRNKNDVYVYEYSNYLQKSLEDNFTITQKMIYNVETHEIKEIKIVGNSLTLHTLPIMTPYTIDIKITFDVFSEEEFEKKANEIIKYVQTNCNNTLSY